MKTRTAAYLAIKDAKDAGLDGFAFFLMEFFDKLNPQEPSIRKEYDSAVLERLNANRELKDL